MSCHSAIREGSILRWSIRTSFQRYVAALPDGRVTVGDGAEIDADGRFKFAHDPRPPTDPETLPFHGLVEFRGHGRLLDVSVRNPWINLTPNGGGSISVEMPTGRLSIARFLSSVSAGSAISIPAPRLLSAGVSLLGDVYEPGDAVDPIDIRVSSITTVSPVTAIGTLS